MKYSQYLRQNSLAICELYNIYSWLGGDGDIKGALKWCVISVTLIYGGDN